MKNKTIQNEVYNWKSQTEQAVPTMEEVTAYLSAVPKFGALPGLDVVSRLYRVLGEPAADLPAVHVAGTNGKGSVCAFLCSVLTGAGYTVGLFTSPHLVDIRERIRIGDQMIPETDFCRAFARVRRCAGDEGLGPSYFELLYLTAMVYYEEKKPDFLILETGLGGRLDATNSFPHPRVSVITRIGLDHMQFLGDTKAKIAGEKAGIVKKGVPLVFLDAEPEVTQVLRAAADKAGSPAFAVDPAQIHPLHGQLSREYGEKLPAGKVPDKGIDFSYDSGYYGCKSFFLSTQAWYQCENAALAMMALAQMERLSLVHLSGSQLFCGLAGMHWAGRMEEIAPGVYFDGAHNPDGIHAFLESVGRMTKAEDARRYLLFSVVADKDYREMIQLLQDSSLFAQAALAPLQIGRGADLHSIADCFDRLPHRCFSDVQEAFCWCLKQKRKQDIVYVAGSLYLVGQLKEQLAEGKVQLHGDE